MIRDGGRTGLEKKKRSKHDFCVLNSAWEVGYEFQDLKDGTVKGDERARRDLAGPYGGYVSDLEGSICRVTSLQDHKNQLSHTSILLFVVGI